MICEGYDRFYSILKKLKIIIISCPKKLKNSHFKYNHLAQIAP